MNQSGQYQKLLEHLHGRLAGLRTNRYSWWVHWLELANYILPRRYKWLVTPNQTSRGSPINGFIIDSSGTLAARNCASGLMAGITSPTRPWFRFGIKGIIRDDANPAALWMSEVESRIMTVMQESNFYTGMGVVYHDLTVFGTGPMYIYEDYDDVIRCYNPCAGEYFVDNSYRLQIDTIYREFTLTTQQVMQEFPDADWSALVRQAANQGGGALTREVVVQCAVEPNDDRFDVVSQRFPYREVYWERGADNNQILSARGFHEFPAICPRWDIVSNDAYGRSPGMDALPDIKQLQQETRRKAQAIDKIVNPPMVADVQMKNQPASLLPGGVTYVTGLTQSGRPGFAPVYQVNPNLADMTNDLNEIKERISRIFFNDLFLMISSLDTVRTATEIDARREEKLVMLGPVLERFQNEALDPAINRIFQIMLRAGLLPPAPPEIQGQSLEIEYVSILAMAQRAARTSGIERVLGLGGNMAAVRPDVLDNINFDSAIKTYASDLNVPPKIMNSEEVMDGIRQQRAAQAAADKQAAQMAEAIKGAETLSKTDMSSRNALTALVGQGAQ